MITGLPTFLVRIKRDTVRRNPDAGRTVYHVAGPTEVTLRFEYDLGGTEAVTEITDKFGGGVHSIQPTAVGPGKRGRFLIEAFACRVPTAEEIRETFPYGCSVVYNRVVQEVHSMVPAPEWLYKMEDPLIHCTFCKSRFYKSHLQSRPADFDEDGEPCAYLDNCCPFCREPECCRLEFESIDSVVKEMGLDKEIGDAAQQG